MTTGEEPQELEEPEELQELQDPELVSPAVHYDPGEYQFLVGDCRQYGTLRMVGLFPTGKWELAKESPMGFDVVSKPQPSPMDGEA